MTRSRTFRVRLRSFGLGDGDLEEPAPCSSAKRALRNTRCANWRRTRREEEAPSRTCSAFAGVWAAAVVSWCTCARLGLQYIAYSREVIGKRGRRRRGEKERRRKREPVGECEGALNECVVQSSGRRRLGLKRHTREHSTRLGDEFCGKLK